MLTYCAAEPQLQAFKGESDPGPVVAGSSTLTVCLSMLKRWPKTPLFLHIAVSYAWIPDHSLKHHLLLLGLNLPLKLESALNPILGSKSGCPPPR